MIVKWFGPRKNGGQLLFFQVYWQFYILKYYATETATHVYFFPQHAKKAAEAVKDESLDNEPFPDDRQRINTYIA